MGYTMKDEADVESGQVQDGTGLGRCTLPSVFNIIILKRILCTKNQ